MTTGRCAITVALAAALLAGCGGEKRRPGPPEGGEPVRAARVTISNYTYRPAVVAVQPGGTVTWLNRDEAPHTATADKGRPIETGTLRPGQSRAIRVGDPGTYAYHCTFHRFMVARVVVK